MAADRKRAKKSRTCDGPDVVSLLTTNQEDDIALRRIDVCIFQQEDPVYAILLQFGEFDEEADWTCQLLTDDEVLLSPSLGSISRELGDGKRVPYSRLQEGLAVPCGPDLCNSRHLPGVPSERGRGRSQDGRRVAVTVAGNKRKQPNHQK